MFHVCVCTYMYVGGHTYMYGGSLSGQKRAANLLEVEL